MENMHNGLKLKGRKTEHLSHNNGPTWKKLLILSFSTRWVGLSHKPFHTTALYNLTFIFDKFMFKPVYWIQFSPDFGWADPDPCGEK